MFIAPDFVKNVGITMTELQPPLDNVLLGEGVKQMQEVSREEILKQIFGDIGELAEGKRHIQYYGQVVKFLTYLIIVSIDVHRLYLCC